MHPAGQDLDFELLFRRAPSLLLVLAPDAPRFTILGATDAYLAATHTERGRIIGSGLFEVFPDNPDDPQADGTRMLRASLERVIASATPDAMAVQKYDIRRPESEGGGFEERFWSPVNSPVCSATGELMYLLHRVEDVTDFVRASRLGEQQRERSEALERRTESMRLEVLQRSAELDRANRKLRAANEQLAELDRAKTVFFSDMSHELRTPLTLLLGPVEDALSDASEPASPGLRARLTLVRRSALRLRKLINGLLDVSRIEAGRMQPSFTRADLTQLTRELASVFRSGAERAGLKLEVECQELGEPAYVDPEMWEKIVLNLLSNALKFTLQGQIAVRLRRDREQFVLSVADTGTGIPAAELPRVFERFHRVRGAQARAQEGTGIGLSLVRELVQLHGGTVEVESELGTGSVFTVSIPAHRARAPAGETPAENRGSQPRTAFVEEAERWLAPVAPEDAVVPVEGAASDGALIVIVDDDADLRAYLRGMLAPHYTVEARSDGVAALALIRERLPDLVVSDVMMPELDGFGLVRALRADPRTSALPVILLSARAGEEAITDGIEAGADDYLVKPFSARELLVRVNTHLTLARARRQLTEQLRQTNEELERANRAKSDFLAMMSHELRTPLNAVIGFSEILIDQLVGPLNERQIRYLQNVHDGGKHLLSLINDLLDLSRIEAGRLELSCRPVNARALAEEAIATLQPLASAADVTLALYPEHGAPPTIYADPVRVKQVLYNLVSNALKFTPAGRRVSVVIEQREGRFLRISVIDQGPGIGPAELERLFKPFVQLDNASKNPGSGSGLGLALTKQLVELMQGGVGVESTLGAGSRFYVDLPLDPAEQQTAQAPEPSSDSRPLALVIDDDPDARELLSLQLQAIGYRVLESASGEQGLALAREQRPDVITLDVFLTGIDGWDVLRALRGDPITAHIPVVLATISSDRHKSFGLGAMDHLVKPIERRTLIEALARHDFLRKVKHTPVHVLAIDDEQPYLELVRAALAPLGFRVTVAETGRAGLSAAEDQVDLILLDLVLPDMSGVEVVEALRREPHTRDIPIVLVTGHELSAADRQRLNGDVEAVLAKHSLSLRELSAEIERTVRKQP